MRKFKTKKRFTLFKTFGFILLILLGFLMTYNYFDNKFNKNIDPELYVQLLLNEGFNNQINDYKYTNPLDLTKPLTLIERSLSFNYNHVIKTDKDTIETISKTNQKNNEEPLVYIYNTHDEEAYQLDNNQGYNINPNVKLAAYMLQEKLEDYNLKTIVETNSVGEILKNNNWNYPDSYKASRVMIDKMKAKYPSIKYFIDLHRDSAGKDLTTLTIDNVNYAKMIFIVGLENPNYNINLNMANSLSNGVNVNIDGLSKGIYKKEGPGVNGVYNQDVSGNAILIEIGGYENTIDEVAKTINIFGDTLYKYIEGDNNEKAQL
jgi:stage II sporulation protein P